MAESGAEQEQRKGGNEGTGQERRWLGTKGQRWGTLARKLQ